MAVKVLTVKEHGNKLKEDSSLGCWLSESLRAPVLFVTLRVSVCHKLGGCEQVHACLHLWYCMLCLCLCACTSALCCVRLQACEVTWVELWASLSVFLQSLPAAREVIPSMVLIFRLTALPGTGSYISSGMAWGAFPVCGPSLDLVQGRWVSCRSELNVVSQCVNSSNGLIKHNDLTCWSEWVCCVLWLHWCHQPRFKIPLLRGEPTAQLDQFKKMEGLISSDLDHWLCNLYFQVCVCVRD